MFSDIMDSLTDSIKENPWLAIAAVGAAAVSAVVVADVAEKGIDHCRPKVKPVKGSVLYCDLAYGYAEHSGIYIGDNRIIHLNGKGRIEMIKSDEFVTKWSYDREIYVSSYNDMGSANAVGSAQVAQRAFTQLGKQRDYSLFSDNCHQFTAGCLLGRFENDKNFLCRLKNEAKNKLGCNDWLIWEH